MQVFYRRVWSRKLILTLQVHGLEPTKIMIIMSVVVPVGGLTGSIVAGWISDKKGMVCNYPFSKPNITGKSCFQILVMCSKFSRR